LIRRDGLIAGVGVVEMQDGGPFKEVPLLYKSRHETKEAVTFKFTESQLSKSSARSADCRLPID